MNKSEAKIFIDSMIAKLHSGYYESALNYLPENDRNRDMLGLHKTLLEAATVVYGNN